MRAKLRYSVGLNCHNFMSRQSADAAPAVLGFDEAAHCFKLLSASRMPTTSFGDPLWTEDAFTTECSANFPFSYRLVAASGHWLGLEMELDRSIWEVKAVGPHELLPRSRLNPIVRAALGDTCWFRITRRPIAITPSSGWHIMNELGLLNILDPDTIDGSMPLPLQSTRWVTHLATHTERFLRALDDKLETKKPLLSVLRQSFHCSLFCAFYTTEHILYECIYFPSAERFLPAQDAPDDTDTTSSHPSTASSILSSDVTTS